MSHPDSPFGSFHLRTDIPYFSGDYVDWWIYHVECFFYDRQVLSEDKISIAEIFLVRDSLQWYQEWECQMRRCWQQITWEDFVSSLKARFEPVETLKPCSEAGHSTSKMTDEVKEIIMDVKAQNTIHLSDISKPKFYSTSESCSDLTIENVGFTIDESKHIIPEETGTVTEDETNTVVQKGSNEYTAEFLNVPGVFKVLDSELSDINLLTSSSNELLGDKVVGHRKSDVNSDWVFSFDALRSTKKFCTSRVCQNDTMMLCRLPSAYIQFMNIGDISIVCMLSLNDNLMIQEVTKPPPLPPDKILHNFVNICSSSSNGGYNMECLFEGRLFCESGKNSDICFLKKTYVIKIHGTMFSYSLSGLWILYSIPTLGRCLWTWLHLEVYVMMVNSKETNIQLGMGTVIFYVSLLLYWNRGESEAILDGVIDNVDEFSCVFVEKFVILGISRKWKRNQDGANVYRARPPEKMVVITDGEFVHHFIGNGTFSKFFAAQLYKHDANETCAQYYTYVIHIEMKFEKNVWWFQNHQWPSSSVWITGYLLHIKMYQYYTMSRYEFGESEWLLYLDLFSEKGEYETTSSRLLSWFLLKRNKNMQAKDAIPVYLELRICSNLIFMILMATPLRNPIYHNQVIQVIMMRISSTVTSEYASLRHQWFLLMTKVNWDVMHWKENSSEKQYSRNKFVYLCHANLAGEESRYREVMPQKCVYILPAYQFFSHINYVYVFLKFSGLEPVNLGLYFLLQAKSSGSDKGGLIIYCYLILSHPLIFISNGQRKSSKGAFDIFSGSAQQVDCCLLIAWYAWALIHKGSCADWFCTIWWMLALSQIQKNEWKTTYTYKSIHMLMKFEISGQQVFNAFLLYLSFFRPKTLVNARVATCRFWHQCGATILWRSDDRIGQTATTANSQNVDSFHYKSVILHVTIFSVGTMEVPHLKTQSSLQVLINGVHEVTLNEFNLLTRLWKKHVSATFMDRWSELNIVMYDNARCVTQGVILLRMEKASSFLDAYDMCISLRYYEFDWNKKIEITETLSLTSGLAEMYIGNGLLDYAFLDGLCPVHEMGIEKYEHENLWATVAGVLSFPIVTRDSRHCVWYWFSESRPPELADLEDKVVLKGEGMIRIKYK